MNTQQARFSKQVTVILNLLTSYIKYTTYSDNSVSLRTNYVLPVIGDRDGVNLILIILIMINTDKIN